MKTKKQVSEKEVTKDLATEQAIIKKVKERKTKTKEKNFIYKFQIANSESKKKLTAKEEKKMRSKLRRSLSNIIDKIVIEKKDNKENVKEFISFYKLNYILNDFSIESITNSSDELLLEDLKRVFEIVKKQLEK